MSLPNCGNLYKLLDDAAYDKKSGESFFSVSKILTYGKPWNFITGPRSAGKTTGIATFLLLDFLKNNRCFLYIRRTKDELDLTKKKFFNDAIAIIKRKLNIDIDYFAMEGNDYYIKLSEWEEPKLCGTSFYLSKEEKLKSGGYFIYNIVYDEFISQDSCGYLGTLQAPKEYEKTLELYTSMDRGVDTPYRNEVRFFFLGNTATIYNPIFTELNIVRYIQDTSKIIAPKGEAWLLQQLSIDDIRVLKDYKDSFVYMLSNKTQIDYNFNNRGRDTNAFIEKMPQGTMPLVTLAIAQMKIGVYMLDGIFYMSKPQEARHTPVYSLDIDSHDGIIDREFIHRYGSNDLLQQLVKSYTDGRLRFENGQIKNIFLKYFRFLPN